jgi:hypothetical protein
VKEKIKGLMEKYWKKGALPLICATALVTLGVYFSFPEMGFVATLPLMFLASALGFFLYRKLWFFPLSAFLIAGFYGKMAVLPDPVSYAVFSAVISLFAAGAVKLFLSFLEKKKILSVLLSLVLCALGVFVGFFYMGSPAAHLKMAVQVENYLSQTYPLQTFSDIRIHYDYREKNYRVTAAFEDRGNWGHGEFVFADGVLEDGFFQEYTDYITETRKSALVSAFQKNRLSVVTEISDFPREKVSAPYQIVFGQENEEWSQLMNYSVTFRKEKPDRREFAQACAEALHILQEEKLVFGSVTFYGLDAGREVYRCEVNYDTSPDEVLSLVVAIPGTV